MLRVTPCLEIYEYKKTGLCPIQDDMTSLYSEIASSHRLILTSPTFYSVTAHSKAFIDGCQPGWARHYVLGKYIESTSCKGAFIAVGAKQRKKIFEGLKPRL